MNIRVAIEPFKLFVNPAFSSYRNNSSRFRCMSSNNDYIVPRQGAHGR